ncbi:MAG: hypothetical protein ABI871_07940 [Chthoniobacterales bacterium]
MKPLAAPILLAIGCAALSLPALAEPLPRSVSTSREFIVYGVDTPLRGALCDLAERTKRDLLTLLDLRDEWETPVIVNAQFPQANVPESAQALLHFSQTGFGLKFQLDVVVPPDVSAPAVQRELLRATLLEIMYRRHPNVPPGAAYVQPPDWLLDGALAHEQRETAPSTGLLRALNEADGLMSLEIFLRQRPALLDTTSRALYAACSRSLLELLIERPGGRTQLARFVVALADSTNDPLADLRSHFPVLAEDPEKAWRAGVSRIAASGGFALLSPAKTEEQLSALLHIRVAEKGHPTRSYALEEFAQFVSSKTARRVLRGRTDDLVLLSARANPLSRPVVIEYGRIAALLSRGKTSRMRERLTRVSRARLELGQTGREIDDYLNWFEATQSPTASGAFAEYLRAAGRTPETPQRHDPISLYVSSIETQFRD